MSGESAVQNEQVAIAVDPRLMPPAAGRVVDVETHSASAASSHPVLLENARIQFARNVVRAGKMVRAAIADGPFTDPEIELMVFRSGARRCGCR